MNKFKVFYVALSLLTALNINASELVLDSFNYVPDLDIVANPTPGSQVVTATSISAETGALADYTLEWLSGTASITAEGNKFNSGSLSYAEGPLSDGTLEIAYSLPGAGTLDFTGFSDFFFDVVAIDGSGGFDLMLTLEDFDGTQISASYNIASTGVFLASFASMMPGVDFDFTQVLSSTAFITSNGDGDDFTLDAVGLIPEPSALAILGLGLIGLGLRRRKLV